MPTLTLAQANQIVAKALEKARAMKIKPVTVVVLDDAGHLKAMQREDGASMFRFDVATGKAWAAVGMGASSRALAVRAKDNPNFFITLAATAGGKFLPQIGGVLIRDSSGANPRDQRLQVRRLAERQDADAKYLRRKPHGAEDAGDSEDDRQRHLPQRRRARGRYSKQHPERAHGRQHAHY